MSPHQHPATAEDLATLVAGFLADHDPAVLERTAFLRARFDAGLAWVHYPEGLGGLGLPRGLQPTVEAAFEAAVQEVTAATTRLLEGLQQRI